MIPSYYDTALEHLHAEARDLFVRALETASIPAAFDRHLHFEKQVLMYHPVANWKSIAIPLDDYKLFVIALGKAALPMLDTLEARLPAKLSMRGICCAPSIPRRRHWRIRYYAGGHPLPNQDSFRAAQTALRLLRQMGEKALIFFLISGGGSAIFELPLDKRISLEDTRAFHEALVGCGATITEINTVRKHFSAVKGGRLAVAASQAAKFSLLVSDVPVRHLDALASGPTIPDHSTVEECREILHRYHLADRFPESVRAFFDRADLPETPGDKSSPEGSAEAQEQPGFANSRMDTLLSNHDLVSAARDLARERGYKVVIDNSCDDWDYRDAARYLLQRFYQLRREHRRLCLLSGGEVTVRLNTKPGTGGRNQQFALACALELAAEAGKSPRSRQGESIAVLSAGSDGVDGNSAAAGAIADPTTISRALAHAFDPAAALEGFDACPLFTALGDTVVTGPTHNNLRDLRILLGVED